ncbi:MAG: peroxidase-related enzyme [Bacteroidetes bacterium]|nr:peroxidase-related enzyme [Bacteroidota bacterium]
MAHIDLPEHLPGITGPLQFRPQTGEALSHLAQTLLRGNSPLKAAERELIAAYVSGLNECAFCHRSHAAAARSLFGVERSVVDAVVRDLDSAPIGQKMKALLRIAAKVQQGGRNVAPEDIAAARMYGADDVEIHDTVLVAAAFCMYNRYVDGLATWAPEDGPVYDAMGDHLAAEGYGAANRNA